ncbi:MAG: hypothetical protein V3T04_00815 [Dehalococcoidia bacterium]
MYSIPIIVLAILLRSIVMFKFIVRQKQLGSSGAMPIAEILVFVAY